MESADIVAAIGRAAIRRDPIALRAHVAELRTSTESLAAVGRPLGLNPREEAAAAGIVELLAARSGQAAPAWTARVGKLPQPVYLVAAAERSPHLQALCAASGPEPLRRRNVLAPPEFLSFA